MHNWQSLETAPHACHVLACYFDFECGEWVIDVVMSPPKGNYQYWQALPEMPY